MSRMCALLEVGRDSYYRWSGAPGPPSCTPRGTEAIGNEAMSLPTDDDLLVWDAIQHIALEMSSYGYRTITKELRRRGLVVNHKRVLRLLHEDNLLCLRKKRFHTTTDSNHAYPVYPNLVPSLQVDGLHQLWVADITYIRLQREFIYLAVVLDAFSRRCIGWALESYLDARLSVAALRMALATRTVAPGLVHHSDRGVQYACGDYTALLHTHGIQISMSRRGNPYDNAQAESFIKTLKYEEVYLNEYQTMTQARTDIGHFLESVYNQKRLRSSLGYLPPAEFEAAWADNGP
ncbi:MAG TPA: IS3 family transposase [Abditibacteriaceae bacterium]|nr:IS3 family transposase [Abditibacteriaceae bacterium]